MSETSKYVSIPTPTLQPAQLFKATFALKQGYEQLTGQRPSKGLQAINRAYLVNQNPVPLPRYTRQSLPSPQDYFGCVAIISDYPLADEYRVVFSDGRQWLVMLASTL